MMDSQQDSESPVIEGTPGIQRMSKSIAMKQKKTQKAIHSAINSAREAHHARDVSSDSSSSPARSPAKKRGHKKVSPIWNHCHNKEVNGQTMTFCDYCPNLSWKLRGSTSTALYHVKQHHCDKLTDEEIVIMTEKTKGTQQTSPSSKLTARSPKAFS